MVAHPSPAALETPVVRCGATFRALADGRRHALDDLAVEATNASRDAVRDQLATLRSLGMPVTVDAGHAQALPFTPLDAEAIGEELRRASRPCRAPWQVTVAFEIGSTNTELLRDVKQREHLRAPVVLAAEFQHAGRGRLGRGWSSAPGVSIAVSFATRIARGIGQLDGVTLVCGLAVQRVVAALGVPVRLKWPNDLLVDDRKLAGILVEAHADGAATTLVIGVGINVAFAAPVLASPSALRPASLLDAGSGPIDRNRLIARIALALETRLATFEADGFAPFVDDWNAVDAFAGRAVRLESPPAPPIAGIARGVDDGGALRLEHDGTMRRIIAGDVSLRPAALADLA